MAIREMRKARRPELIEFIQLQFLQRSELAETGQPVVGNRQIDEVQALEFPALEDGLERRVAGAGAAEIQFVQLRQGGEEAVTRGGDFRLVEDEIGEGAEGAQSLHYGIVDLLAAQGEFRQIRERIEDGVIGGDERFVVGHLGGEFDAIEGVFLAGQRGLRLDFADFAHVVLHPDAGSDGAQLFEDLRLAQLGGQLLRVDIGSGRQDCRQGHQQPADNAPLHGTPENWEEMFRHGTALSSSAIGGKYNSYFLSLPPSCGPKVIWRAR